MRRIKFLGSFAIVAHLSPLFYSSISHASIPAKNNEVFSLLSKTIEEQDSVKPSMQLGKDLWSVAFDSNQNADHRWRALILAMKHYPSSSNGQKALKHKDWFIRNALLEGSRQYQKNESRRFAQILLNDRALVVRSAAVQVIADNLDLSSRALLWGELNAKRNFIGKQSLWIRSQIVSALSNKPQSIEFTQFRTLLDDHDQKVQGAAIQALEKIKGQATPSENSSLSQKLSYWKKQSVKL